ncbi:MAG: hypothetical protein MJZ28_09540 [Paludibacteraceae bacterium]|nr:hypothetical protein [Paludibacteraceae bacterium]
MKKNIISIITLLLISTIASAKEGPVKGQYSFKKNNMKGTKVWIAGTQDTTRLDKKGRFKIKKADLENDTLMFETVKGKSIVVPLGGKDIVQITREDSTINIQLSKEERKPFASYGGQIYTKAELEQTGETFVMNAISAKCPQSTFSSFKPGVPLYFIDGTSVFSISLPVKEVAFVEVVKATNASNSAFGARGGNGAILVTTEGKWKTMMEE